MAQREGRGGPFDHCDQLDDDGNGSPGEQNHDIGDEGQHDDERQVSLVVIPPRFRQDHPQFARGPLPRVWLRTPYV